MPYRCVLAFLVVGSSSVCGAQTTNWILAGSGLWSTAANWSAGLPAFNTDAQISSAGLLITVDNPSGSPLRVRSLLTNSRIKVLNGAGLELHAPASGTGDYEVEGTLNALSGFSPGAARITLQNGGGLRFGQMPTDTNSHDGNIVAGATLGSVEAIGTLTLTSSATLTGNFQRVSAFNLINQGTIAQTGGTLRIDNVHNHGSISSDASGSIGLLSNTGHITVSGTNRTLRLSGTHTQESLAGTFVALGSSGILYEGSLTLSGSYGFENFTGNFAIGGRIFGGRLLNSSGQNFFNITFENGTTFDTGLNLDAERVTIRYAPDFGSSGVFLNNGSQLNVRGTGVLAGGLFDLRNGSTLNLQSALTLRGNYNLVDSALQGSSFVFEAGSTLEATRSTVSAGSSTVNNGLMRLLDCDGVLGVATNNGQIEVLSGSNLVTSLSSNGGHVLVNGTGTKLEFSRLVTPSFVNNVTVSGGGEARFQRVDLGGGSFDLAQNGIGKKFAQLQNGTLVNSLQLTRIPDYDVYLSDVVLDQGAAFTGGVVGLHNVTSHGDIHLDSVGLFFNNSLATSLTAPNLIVRNLLSTNIPALSSIVLNTNVDIINSNFAPNGSTVTVASSRRVSLSNGIWGRAGSTEGNVFDLRGTLIGQGDVISDTRVIGGIAAGSNGQAGTIRFLGGKLTLSTAATTEIEVFSDVSSDVLVASGANPVQLGGRLVVKLGQGYTYTGTSSYDVITSTAGFSGQFSDVVLPSGWQVKYSSNRVTVLAVPEPFTIASFGAGMALLRLRRRR